MAILGNIKKVTTADLKGSNIEIPVAPRPEPEPDPDEAVNMTTPYVDPGSVARSRPEPDEPEEPDETATPAEVGVYSPPVTNPVQPPRER